MDFVQYLGVFTKLFFKVRCNNFSLFFLVVDGNPLVSMLITSGIFGFWRWISFITRNILEESFLLLSVSFRRFSSFCSFNSLIFRWIVFMISLQFIGRHFRFSVSFLDVVWIAERFHHLHGEWCIGFFPRTVSAVSFIAWAVSFHLLSLMFGSLRNLTFSSFLYWSAATVLFRLSRFTCALYFILGRKGHFILHDIITSLWSEVVIIPPYEWALVILIPLCFLTKM